MFVMYIGRGALLWVGLIVLGVVWCKEVIGRFRSDVEELRGCEGKVRKGGDCRYLGGYGLDSVGGDYIGR